MICHEDGVVMARFEQKKDQVVPLSHRDRLVISSLASFFLRNITRTILKDLVGGLEHEFYDFPYSIYHIYIYSIYHIYI